MIRIQPDYLRRISGKLQEKEIIFLAMPSDKKSARYKNVRQMLDSNWQNISNSCTRAFIKILCETSRLCPEKTETKLFNSVIHKR